MIDMVLNFRQEIGNYRQKPRDGEAELLDYTEKLRRHAASCTGVHIHLSRLQSYNRRAHHIRIALHSFEEFVRQYEGHIFSLSNDDIIFIARGVGPLQIDEAVTKLRYLFSEDPLTQNGGDSEASGFCTWYRLDQNYPDFLAKIRQIHAAAEKGEGKEGGDIGELRVPLRPADLAHLEDKLATADLTDLVRHQAICSYIPGQTPSPVFHEIYVSIDDLASKIATGKDIAANKWLFQHLTQMLDKRMLAYLAHDGNQVDRAFSLNLNLATLLSPEFQRFDERINPKLRGRLVIELQKIDIFADMGAYRFARDYVHERGYRICLDGMTHLTMPYIDRKKLGCDMVKMFWSPEIAASAKPELIKEVRDAVEAAGTSRVILSRCDSKEALEVGRGYGITLFQGRYIERQMVK